MLEQMWPVYARGIAEDFLPALGSNPCEVRETLEAIGRQCDAVREGRPRRPSTRLVRQTVHEVDELPRVAHGRSVAEAGRASARARRAACAERRFSAGSGVK